MYNRGIAAKNYSNLTRWNPVTLQRRERSIQGPPSRIFLLLKQVQLLNKAGYKWPKVASSRAKRIQTKKRTHALRVAWSRLSECFNSNRLKQLVEFNTETKSAKFVVDAKSVSEFVERLVADYQATLALPWAFQPYKVPTGEKLGLKYSKRQ